MIRFNDRTRLIGNYPYFCDENGNVYAMGYDIGKYGYKIVTFYGGKEKEIKNPTNEQRLYALLNYVWVDNLTNPHKKGIYNLSDEQIVDDFNMFFNFTDNPNFTTKGIFARFGLNPSGEIQQAALNGLIKDIVLTNKKFAKKSELEYVFRGETPVSFVALRRAEDGKTYVVKPDYSNYGFKIFENEGKEVKNPNEEQRENAFLNLVLADNVSNPSKTGIYNQDLEVLEDAVNLALCYIKKDKFDKDKILRKFGLEYNGELMASAVDDLVDRIIKDKKQKNGDQTVAL